MPYLHAPEDLGELVREEPSYRVDQLRDWLYRTPVLHARDMTNLPQEVRSSIEGRLERRRRKHEKVALPCP